MSKCDQCDKETMEAYELANGDYVCLSCMEKEEAYAEYIVDSYRDEGLI